MTAGVGQGVRDWHVGSALRFLLYILHIIQHLAHVTQAERRGTKPAPKSRRLASSPEVVSRGERPSRHASTVTFFLFLFKSIYQGVI